MKIFQNFWPVSHLYFLFKVTEKAVAAQSTVGKKWRLYILPQCLANLTQPKRHKKSLIVTIFVPVLRILSNLDLKIL